MDYLVGCTGFVGSNLLRRHIFSEIFHSKNIERAFSGNPDLLVYAGVPAEMFLANTNPEADMKIIQNAIENIKKINPKRLVLISTIAVYPNPVLVDESTDISLDGLTAYGYNRRVLEKWVEEHYETCLIVRLPALYGQNLKKNFIYDFIHIIPSLLNRIKFNELCKKDDSLKDYYELQESGLYKVRVLNEYEREQLKTYFQNIGFNALNFTDSRARYQFYNLKRLWEDIELAMNNSIKIFNPSTEPVEISELYEYLTGCKFCNVLNKEPFIYDYRTKYSELFGGKDGYLLSKEQVMEDVKRYIAAEM